LREFNAQILVYNTSKKTALTFSSISIVGPNAADILDPALLATALKGLPAKRGSVTVVQVTFTAGGEGPRNATLQFVSNAGTLIQLSGAGLANRPIIAGIGGSLHFIDVPPVVSAPDVELDMLDPDADDARPDPSLRPLP
jgi:hypothetical protein